MKLIPASARHSVSGIGKVAFTVAGIGMLASFAPRAKAAGEADGSYQIKRFSTSFVSSGSPITVPKQLLKNALFKKGTIDITDNQISLLRDNWADVLNTFNFTGIEGSLKVTGPDSLTLTASGDAFTGMTESPVVLTLKGKFLGTEIKMDLKAKYSAKLVGTQLTIIAPVRIRTLGALTASGTVKLVAEKL